MTPSNIAGENLKAIMDKAGVSATVLSQLGFESGITENPTTLKPTIGRILRGDSNVRMKSLETICQVIRLLPGFENLKFADLFSVSFESPVTSINAKALESLTADFLDKMNELGWLQLKQDVCLVAPSIRLIAKNHGFVVTIDKN